MAKSVIRVSSILLFRKTLGSHVVDLWRSNLIYQGARMIYSDIRIWNDNATSVVFDWLIDYRFIKLKTAIPGIRVDYLSVKRCQLIWDSRFEIFLSRTERIFKSTEMIFKRISSIVRISYMYSLSAITRNFVKRYIRDTFERYKSEFAIKRSTKRRTPNIALHRNVVANYVKKGREERKWKGIIYIYVYETVRHVLWRMTNATAINQHFRSIVRKKRASPQMLLPFVLRCLNTVHGISSLSLCLSLFNEVAPGQQPNFSTRKTRSHGAPQSNRVETRDQTFVIRTDAAEMSTGTINAAPRCNACPTGTMGIPSD